MLPKFVKKYFLFRFSNASCSRISKSSLLSQFTALCSRMQERGRKSISTEGKTYYELKASSGAYQKAKKIRVDKFDPSGWGRWVGKPLEEDMFL